MGTEKGSIWVADYPKFGLLIHNSAGMAACIKKPYSVEFIDNKLCGEGGIRTLDTLYRGILT